jgi:hypothetical protein
LLEEADIQYILVYFEPSRELEALDIFADNIIKEESTGSQDTTTAAKNINQLRYFSTITLLIIVPYIGVFPK